MLNKNINGDEINSNMLNLDEPESEMGGDKKKLDKKAIIFIVFVLFLLLGLIILFSPSSSDKDKVEEAVVKKPQKISLPSLDMPKLNFADQPPPPSDDKSVNSLDLVKKRQLNLVVIEEPALGKSGFPKSGQANELVIKKTYGLNALDSSSFLDEESASQYLIKRRSSVSSPNSTLMVIDDLDKGKSNILKTTARESNVPEINSDLDFSDFLKNEKPYVEELNSINNTKQNTDSSKIFPESVLGESINAAIKPEPYHATVLARKIPMNPSLFILQGTSIRCVMETMVVSDVSGPTLCVVSEPIRSSNGLKILIPKGSKVIGDYEKTSSTQERVPIIWTRLITPDNIDIALNSIGTTSLGVTNAPASVDKRWGERLFTATLISLGIDAFAWKVVDNLPKKSKTTIVDNTLIKEEVDFDSIAVKNARSFTEEELKKSLAIPYRLVINQGTIGSIFVARDLDFSNVYPSGK